MTNKSKQFESFIWSYEDSPQWTGSVKYPIAVEIFPVEVDF